MARHDKSIIFPDKSLFLVHKLQGAKSSGESPQWQTRSQGPFARLDTHTAQSGPASSHGRAKKPALEFVSYDHDRATTRPASLSRKAISRTSLLPPTKPRRNERNLKLQRASNRRHGSPNAAPLGYEPMSDQAKLGNTVLGLSIDLPASLSNHFILYINFFFHVIATKAYPLSSLLSFNPAQKNWFPHMLANDAWLYTILSLSASTLASITNHSTSHQDARNLLEGALQRLNRRISDDQVHLDETLGAVACLANWSNSLGDHQKSWVHTRGLAELIALRGGLSNINDKLKSKMYRGILEMAVDSDSASFIQQVSHLTAISVAELTPPLPNYTRNVECSCQTHPILIGLFQDVSKLSAGFEYAIAHNTRIDPDFVDSTIFSLLQRLLLCGSITLHDCNNAFRICLILYIKSLTCRRDQLLATSITLVRKLQAFVRPCLDCKSPLATWKLFFGCLVTANGTPEREWFAQSLSNTFPKENESRSLEDWVTVQEELKSVLWITPIHGEHGKLVWSQICNKI